MPAGTQQQRQSTSDRLTSDSTNTNACNYVVHKVEDWLIQNNTNPTPDYVFISYTRLQFYTESESSFDLSAPAERLNAQKAAAIRDRKILTDHGVAATKKADSPAFWIDFECLKGETDDKKESNMEDVYRICDVVRATATMAIVIGPTLENEIDHIEYDTSCRARWLREWGGRMWTVPEALLCPSEHRITLYTVGLETPEMVAKRNLAVRAWDDAVAVRQLIDHYEGSLHLTQLELISIALECFQRRRPETRKEGEPIEVLMGLVRLRPKVVNDTDFQAFSRLSLANDSGNILEKIICLQNPDKTSKWHDMYDLWGAKLWHIGRLCQIAGIGDHNAVIIGGASGTNIDWASLKPVDFHTAGRRYVFRWNISRCSVTMSMVYLAMYLYLSRTLMPIFLEAVGQRFPAGIQASMLRFVIALTLALQAPFSLSNSFRGQLSATQARMFGLQGKACLPEVERLIFGASCGRLKWNNDSAYHRGGYDDGTEEFTLVDTVSCTATIIHATRPPTLAFVGAKEGGLLRRLLCSYDESMEAFVKEIVVRTKVIVAEKMQRLDNFHFSIAPDLYRDDVTPR